MGRYRSPGNLDDPTVEDGDRGFVGVNQRLHPSQLSPGEIRISKNGRIDGYWIPRKGVDVVSSVLDTTGHPLRLPFWLEDTSLGASISAAVLDHGTSTVTLTVTGHGYGMDHATLSPAGSNNDVLVTRVGVTEDEGDITVEIVAVASQGETGISVVGNSIEVTPGDMARMVITGTLTEDGVSPVTFADMIHAGFFEGNEQWTNTGDLVDGGIDPTKSIIGRSGDWTLSKETVPQAYWTSTAPVISPDLVSTNYPGAWDASTNPHGWKPTSPATGTPTIAKKTSIGQDVVDALNDNYFSSALVNAANAAGNDGTGVAASAGPVTILGGSQLSAYIDVTGLTFSAITPNGAQLVTPTDEDTLTFTLDGGTVADTYAGTGLILSSLVDTAYDSIFGSCVFSDPSDSNNEFIMVAVNSFVAKISLEDGSLTTIDYPGSETISADVHMIQCFDKVLILRDGLVAMEWSPGDAAFALVDYGAYTQPSVFTVGLDSVSVSDGLCTVVLAGDHSAELVSGDSIFVYSVTDITKSGSPLTESTIIWGERSREVVSSVYSSPSTTVKFYLPVGDTVAGSASDSMVIGKRISVGGGFIHQPGMPWGVYFQRRLWGPYHYFWDTDPTPDAFTSRDIRDELVASDILDYDTFDTIENQYRVTAGIADHTVALQPFFDDALMVLNRNSIHLIGGTSGDLRDTNVRELTREVGCLARKSVVAYGNRVFFLSDNGVYGVGFSDEYNLRGIEKPLSENIQPIIDRLNYDLSKNAVGIYFNNRYWLALPLDSSPMAGDARGNNTIIIYNVLNQSWESEDTFGDDSFIIKDFHIGYAETRNNLYVVATSGGIHILDVLDEIYDNLVTGSSGESAFSIDSVFQSRGYTMQTMDRKRFNRVEIAMQSGSAQSDITIGFSTDDPDSVATLTTASATLGNYIAPEDSANIRARTGGVRGYDGSITLTRVFGRPQINSVKAQAIITNRATISQQ